MTERYHGVDKHTTHLTITIVDSKGEIVNRIHRCTDFNSYVESLGPNDHIAIEAGNQTFHLADRMESRNAKVSIINPRDFKIITQSKKKTDKNDSLNLALSLCQSVQENSVLKLPLVYKPEKGIRELRTMFSVLQTLNKSIVQMKNSVIGILRDFGVENHLLNRKVIFHEELFDAYLQSVEIPDGIRIAASSLIRSVIESEKKKEELKTEIIKQGMFLKEDVEILISIKGVSPLLALAFLADVGDLERFKNLRGLNCYLGLVPITRASGQSCYQGHIIRQSRSLTRTLFTQAVAHIGKSSEAISLWYQNVRVSRGIGRGRIALIRKIVGIMRRLLLDRELYQFMDRNLYSQKIKNYRRIIGSKEKASA